MKVDPSDCEAVVDKINEITMDERMCDEQKLYGIHILLDRNVNYYVNLLKTQLHTLKKQATEAVACASSMKEKYRTHLEHTQKRMEEMEILLKNRIDTAPKKRYIVKVKGKGGTED